MNDKPMTKAAAKQFLLGGVEDSKREQIESLLITDPDTEETILIAEEELIEDYLEGSLSESDRIRFLSQYAYGPREQRKLRIAESIREYAQADARRMQSGSAVQTLRRISGRWQPKRRLYLPIAVAVATVLVVASVWLAQWNSHRMRDDNLRLALEGELAELNTPSRLRENPPQMLSLVLPSVSLRSVNSPAEIAPQTAYRIIELQLLWPQEGDSQSYLAVLRRVGGREEFKVFNLRAEQKPGGKVVRLRVPAQSLAPGLYHTSLSALASDGTPGPAEEYDFIIGG